MVARHAILELIGDLEMEGGEAKEEREIKRIRLCYVHVSAHDKNNHYALQTYPKLKKKREREYYLRGKEILLPE